MIKYEIIQSIKSVKKRWSETVFSGDSERMARMEYDRLTRVYPDEYFELLKIETITECLAFTAFKGSQ